MYKLSVRAEGMELKNIVSLNNINIDKNIVYKFLGYGNRKIPEVIKSTIDEEIDEISTLLDISVFIKEIDIVNHNFTGEYIRECFSNSSRAYAVLYTIGNSIDKKINAYMSGSDMMRGLALDKIGIVALDDIYEKIKSYILYENRGKKISYEIYPSSRDFEVSNQKYIYEYVKNNKISINEYNQLNPIKSVAMIICIGNVENCISRCEECSNEECELKQ